MHFFRIFSRYNSQGIMLSFLLNLVVLYRVFKCSLQVINTSESYEGIRRDGWSAVSCQILRQIIKPICMEWFEGELSLKNCKKDMVMHQKKK